MAITRGAGATALAKAAAARCGLFIALAAALAACAESIGFEVAYLIRDEQAYQDNIDAAVAGDPAAQYAVGKSRCCAGSDGRDAYYNTVEATKWLCAAAAQGYGPAMHQLGDIYSGEALEQNRFLRELFTSGADKPVHPQLAYAWYRRARESGSPKSGIRYFALRPQLTEAEINEAEALALSTRPLPCQYEDVAAAGDRFTLSQDGAQPWVRRPFQPAGLSTAATRPAPKIDIETLATSSTNAGARDEGLVIIARGPIAPRRGPVLYIP